MTQKRKAMMMISESSKSYMLGFILWMKRERWKAEGNSKSIHFIVTFFSRSSLTLSLHVSCRGTGGPHVENDFNVNEFFVETQHCSLSFCYFFSFRIMLVEWGMCLYKYKAEGAQWVGVQLSFYLWIIIWATIIILQSVFITKKSALEKESFKCQMVPPFFPLTEGIAL